MQLLFYYWIYFFCKGNAVFSAEGPVPRRRAAALWTEQELPPWGAACHTRAQQTLHDLSLLQHGGLLILQRSQWSPSTADSCERNSHSLGCALIACLKLDNSEGWGISFFLMHRQSLRTGKLFLWFLPMPILPWLMGVQRETKVISGTQGCYHRTDKDIFSLLSSVTEDNYYCYILYCDYI